MATYIYGLKDPRDGLIHYVGKSVHPRNRLQQHLHDTSSTPKALWIRTLCIAGYRPELVILDKVRNSEWQNAEKRWIEEGREKGWPLTNSTGGGDGVPANRGPEIFADYLVEPLRSRFLRFGAKRQARIGCKMAHAAFPFLLARANKIVAEDIAKEMGVEYAGMFAHADDGNAYDRAFVAAQVAAAREMAV